MRGAILEKRIKEGSRLGGRISKNCQLQPVWIWPEKVRQEISSYMFGRGTSLNICSGLSDLGDIKVDIDPKNASIQKADMNKLPFADETFDVVLSDPPWKISFFKRMKPFFEAVRVCKTGGTIIYNCTWWPISKFVKLEKALIRADNNFCNISIIYFFRKIAPVRGQK
jgi:ubiquinone/menaquinone biosynthesis C-methylase UbiE